MARDRLAAIRKDKGVETFESSVGGASSGETSAGVPMGELFHMEEFMTGVDEVRGQIQRLRDSTTALRHLHSTALSSQPSPTLSPAQLGTTDAQRLSADSAELSNAIRARIVGMAQKNRRSTLGDPSFEARKKQLEGLQGAFKRALEELFQVEKEARSKARERIERQYKTVKPTATQEELDEALAGSVSGRQVFAEALATQRQTGARTAYTEAQYRNEELREIEKTMGECAQLMNDMANLVLDQDFAMEQIEQDASQVHEDVEAGHRQVTIGKKLAAAARKKRWWGFGIFCVIIIVLAIVLGVTIPK